MAPSARTAEHATPVLVGCPQHENTVMSGAAGLCGAEGTRNISMDTADTADFWRAKRARLEDIQRMCRGKPLQPILGCAPHVPASTADLFADGGAGQLRGPEHYGAGGAVSGLTNASLPHRAPGNTDFPRDLRGSVHLQSTSSDVNVDPKVPMRVHVIRNKEHTNKHHATSMV